MFFSHWAPNALSMVGFFELCRIPRRHIIPCIFQPLLEQKREKQNSVHEPTNSEERALLPQSALHASIPKYT